MRFLRLMARGSGDGRVDAVLLAWAVGLGLTLATLLLPPAPPAPVPPVVQAAGPTGLALFGAARYTRHPAEADRFAAFQSFPGAVDHFPAGSVLPPPGVTP